MEEIFEIVLNYASIWGPSVVAMLAMVFTAFIVINKVLTAVVEFRKDSTIKDIDAKLANQETIIKRLERTEKKLINSITKIEGYEEE